MEEAMILKLPPLDLLDLLPDAVCVVDAEGHFVFVSAGFEHILGYARDEVLGRLAFDLVHPDDRAATVQQAQQLMNGTPQRHFRNRYVHKEGHSVDMRWSARWHPEHGVRIAVGREVTELRRAERELEYLANHDTLTGLPNRHWLKHELQRTLEHAKESGGHLALLYLDLDGFKAANDLGGHETGDRLLREVAAQLKQGLRADDLLARVGGDEFVVLLPGCRDAGTARKVAEGLRARLRLPWALPGGAIQLDASVGIACFPMDGSDTNELLAYADRAMYSAKRQRVEPSDAEAADAVLDENATANRAPEGERVKASPRPYTRW